MKCCQKPDSVPWRTETGSETETDDVWSWCESGSGQGKMLTGTTLRDQRGVEKVHL